MWFVVSRGVPAAEHRGYCVCLCVCGAHVTKSTVFPQSRYASCGTTTKSKTVVTLVLRVFMNRDLVTVTGLSARA